MRDRALVGAPRGRADRAIGPSSLEANDCAIAHDRGAMSRSLQADNAYSLRQLKKYFLTVVASRDRLSPVPEVIRMKLQCRCR
ncbi:hypothetical protein [Burkholderia alba]|uniref:hypothetical protein n=1 Tax=Burkholderia alba TaxID=2683677 RepID=UPI002B057CD5|nr:hypothetical protein [Burkholderia alba]